ncbi:MAG: 2-dehydropantoate 2-reductase [Syntrophales bacterium]|nr:2-dehydropantoate 2-reductase [Syntrophales bacterium]
MKIAIMGIGGVGGYYGGLLARRYAGEKNIEIVFIARGEHLKAIQANGLQVQSVTQGDFTARPDLASDYPAGCGVFDLVILCVKGYGLRESAKLLSPSIGEHTVVISVLNGVDNVAKLQSVLTRGRIWNGCVYIGSQLTGPGACQQTGGSCKMFFGNETKDEPDGKWVAAMLRKADIDAEYRSDIRNIAWEKYLFVSPLGNATTFRNTTIGGILKDEEGMKLMGSLIDELLALAAAHGVEFPADIKKATIEKARAFPYEAKTSYQRDFEQGNRTEIETFAGFIVNEARRLGLSADSHEKVYAALKAREG